MKASTPRAQVRGWEDSMLWDDAPAKSLPSKKSRTRRSSLQRSRTVGSFASVGRSTKMALLASRKRRARYRAAGVTNVLDDSTILIPPRYGRSRGSSAPELRPFPETISSTHPTLLQQQQPAIVFIGGVVPHGVDTGEAADEGTPRGSPVFGIDVFGGVDHPWLQSGGGTSEEEEEEEIDPLNPFASTREWRINRAISIQHSEYPAQQLRDAALRRAELEGAATESSSGEDEDGPWLAASIGLRLWNSLAHRSDAWSIR